MGRSVCILVKTPAARAFVVHEEGAGRRRLAFSTRHDVTDKFSPYLFSEWLEFNVAILSGTISIEANSRRGLRELLQDVCGTSCRAPRERGDDL